MKVTTTICEICGNAINSTDNSTELQIMTQTMTNPPDVHISCLRSNLTTALDTLDPKVKERLVRALLPKATFREQRHPPGLGGADRQAEPRQGE